MKKLILLLFIVAASNLVFGQDFLGYRQSNYSGVTGTDLNIASVADNRFVVDVTLFGGSNSTYNNHLYMNTRLMPFWWGKSFNNENSDATAWQNAPNYDKIISSDSTNYFTSINQGNFFEFSNPRGKTRSAFSSTEMDFLNVLVSINRTMGITVQIKNRSMLNVDNFSSELLTLAQNEFSYEDLWGTELNDQGVNVAFNSWMEYNLGFGMVVYDKEEHFMKVGAKLKFLQGLGSLYINTKNLAVNFKNEDTLNYVTGDFDFGYSANIDDYFNTETNSDIGFDNIYQLQSKLGLGADLGFIYEWRPDWKSYKYDMDGETNLWRRDKNKYKLKFSFAVNDIGGMRYDKSENSRNFSANVTGDNVLSLFDFEDTDDLASFNKNLDTLIDQGGAVNLDDKESYYFNLPTHLNIGVDWNIWNDFYLNANAMVGLALKSDAHKVRYPTNISLTPRYDYKWAGASIPMSYNNIAGVRAGLGLRLGPVIIGTGDLKWVFAPGKDRRVRGIDIYAALKVPILYGHPDDIDEDKVSDKFDLCIETPGVWEFLGCPDTDKDGIQDSEDSCPLDFGLAEFQGCPDQDGDKIIDKEDDCPEDAGLAEFNGCPDSDGDKIMDKEDECIDVPGIAIFNGCPDTDGDGIKDSEDLCPENAGPKENQGCPDTDNDGIFDYLDGCPTEAGPSENNGCPWPDTDGDGLLDKDDKCPNNAGPVKNSGCPYTDTDEDGVLDKDDECVNTPGPVENKGCPEVDEEIIKRAFDALQFETSKAVIKEESKESLEDLAAYLVEHEEFRLTIAGHTDSQGAAQSNLILSKKRAESVRNFLESRGVATDRMIVQFFGEDQPIDTNDTKEGRENNRRVEMKVKFE